MKLEKPKVEFIRFDEVVVTSGGGGNKCLDSYTGGVYTCQGANMTVYCSDKSASIGP